MQEPISEVPNTRVITCILWKTASVATKAIPTERTIDPTEKSNGFIERKIKIKRIITASIETAAIRVISRLAEFELSWL